MKCDICGAKIEQTFLSKINGTIARDSNGKKRSVCSVCQKNNAGKSLKEKLG